jgi:hypothetical protein
MKSGQENTISSLCLHFTHFVKNHRHIPFITNDYTYWVSRSFSNVMYIKTYELFPLNIFNLVRIRFQHYVIHFIEFCVGLQKCSRSYCKQYSVSASLYLYVFKGEPTSFSILLQTGKFSLAVLKIQTRNNK